MNLIHVFYARPHASSLTLSFMSKETIEWVKERAGMTPDLTRHVLRARVAVMTGSNYAHVASFEAATVRAGLEDVWTAMQGEEFGVTRQLRIRSMMKGDVIVVEGDVWVVASMGFEKLDDADAAEYVLAASAPQMACPASARVAS